MKNSEQQSQQPQSTSQQVIKKKRKIPVYILAVVGLFLLAFIVYVSVNKEPEQSASDVAPAPLTQAKE